jgi:hypothetical protein
MSKTKPSIVAELRNAIRLAEKSGTTRYQIAVRADVQQAVLSRIMHRKTVVKLDTAEKILASIGKRLVILDK